MTHPPMTVDDFIASVLTELGPEARAVYDGTGADEFEFDPAAMNEGVEPDDAWYEWCDDCGTFHEHWYEYGWEVRPSTLVHFVWCRDKDGDWDIADSFDLYMGGDREAYDQYEEWRKGYAVEEQERLYRKYLEHVSDTGTDPCGEFMVPVEKKTEPWLVHVRDASLGHDGVAFICARENIDTGELQGWFTAKTVPEHVREFLALTVVDPHGTLVAPHGSGYRNVKAMQATSVEASDWQHRTGRHVGLHGGDDGYWQFTIDIERLIRPEGDELAHYLRVKAAEALATA